VTLLYTTSLKISSGMPLIILASNRCVPCLLDHS